MSLRFEILATSKRSRARVGRIHTPHGIIDTPNFVAVGTNGTIKALDSECVDDLGLQLIFCNTYHLLLQPGPDIVRQAGGLHRFMNRRQPIITDSGGFQVFSLAYGSVADELKSRGQKKQDGHVLKITEEGVLFRSYRDGAKILLTPESSIETQKALGADIIIPLDELPPTHIDGQALKASLDRTHRWEQRSLEQHLRHPNGQAMYGVIHGGIDPELRAESCRVLTSLPFDGFAIGGSVGKNRSEMLSMLTTTMPQLPSHQPVHLLGIGDLISLQACVPLGIDTFDSSYPTRAARHGLLLTESEGVKVQQPIYARHFTSLPCGCWTCQRHSLAYLHHLFKSREITAHSLATIHNLHFMVQLMHRLRQQILRDEI
jgi:queuine tRNA-ribosyltransferase